MGNNVLPVTPTRISPRNLPEIDSDEEGDFSKKILQPWADSPILRRSIAASRSIDPATVITNNPKIDLHETFQSVVSAKRPGIACCNSKHATTRKRYEEILSTTGIHSIVVLFKTKKKIVPIYGCQGGFFIPFRCPFGDV